MTVMPSSSDVADKAVSTEDASSGVEVARLEAVLAALVENKVEAMKAAAAASSGPNASHHQHRRAGSAPSSPRRSRLTSSSTVSSSHHHHHHHHHQHSSHHQHHGDKKGDYGHKKRHHDHRHRRHDSAPCADYHIEDPVTHHHKQRHGKGKQKVESPRSARKRRRHSRSPHVHPVSGGLELLRPELMDHAADHELSLINFDRATREALSAEGDYPGLHQSACYISHSAAQIKNPYDEEDYLAFNYADDFEEETFSGPAVLSSGPMVDSHEHFHKPRRKRKRRRRRTLVEVEDVEVELGVGPDDLPPQARWTIMATACLLLAMSLLLVGVTLRMAPIIDEMVRKENEELLNSLNRVDSLPENVTSLPP